jgi:hypothetical protein
MVSRGGFDLYYTEADTHSLDLILDEAERAYRVVTADLGYHPPEQIPLIVYANRAELRQAFGWGRNQSAVGVYWAGTIRLLSPNVWIPAKTEAQRRQAYAKLNPIAHELTHYLLDQMTSGNYPRWFTEGLAQHVEYKSTGYLWLESRSDLTQHLYTLTDLEERFEGLSNQPLAYRQSYLIIDYLVKMHGERRLAELVGRLSRGVAFRSAVEQTYGASMPEIFSAWHHWVERSMQELNRTGCAYGVVSV